VAHIGTLREGPLHAALKEWVSLPGDRFEVPLDGYVIDVVRDGALIEVQTGGFSALGPKLDALLDVHPMTIVAPLAFRTRITKVGDGGEVVDERWSPKRASTRSIFERLVSFPSLLGHPNLSVLAVGTVEREIRRHHEGKAWRRKGWVVEERHLVEVVDETRLDGVADAVTLLPPGLPDPFTTADIAAAADVRRRLAQQMAYCLREMGAIREVTRTGNAIGYRRA
jgi:hypothetical protein